jgi:predicted phosphodiesterase
MSRVLHIGDLHLPFTHKDYLKFCKKVYKQYKCNKVVFAGDIIDHHAMSYHESDPDGLSAGNELREAQRMVKPWYKAFPKATVTIGNHDALPMRKAITFGIPKAMLRSLAEVYETLGWDWVLEKTIDGVSYIHGKGYGKNAALNTCILEQKSIAQGHAHSYAGVQFFTSTDRRIFGLNSGCGIDLKSYAFAYNKNFSVRPILGCGVVIEGVQPHFIPMEL